ncbi:MAG: endonuclease/exonuclease/phosphatase family protein [Bryobacteraceae bacterium]
MAQPFKLTTWNVLATAYIRKSFYPGIAPEVLDPRLRIPAIVHHSRDLASEILCLQEVEADVFQAIDHVLAPLGYAGKLAMKDGRKADGCATFFRTDACALLGEQRLVYRDGMPNSGHIAQILNFDLAGLHLTVVNTHLKWDPPETPAERQYSVRQINFALAAIAPGAALEIICGDFNATPESPVVANLLAKGFDYAHRNRPGAFTCNSSRQAKVIDYLFFRGPASVEPEDPPPIDGATPLPSLVQPSDHLPLSARFSPSSEA